MSDKTNEWHVNSLELAHSLIEDNPVFFSWHPTGRVL